jgi:hypothetical protein
VDPIALLTPAEAGGAPAAHCDRHFFAASRLRGFVSREAASPSGNVLSVTREQR